MIQHVCKKKKKRCKGKKAISPTDFAVIFATKFYLIFLIINMIKLASKDVSLVSFAFVKVVIRGAVNIFIEQGRPMYILCQLK